MEDKKVYLVISKVYEENDTLRNEYISCYDSLEKAKNEFNYRYNFDKGLYKTDIEIKGEGDHLFYFVNGSGFYDTETYIEVHRLH